MNYRAHSGGSFSATGLVLSYILRMSFLCGRLKRGPEGHNILSLSKRQFLIVESQGFGRSEFLL